MLSGLYNPDQNVYSMTPLFTVLYVIGIVSEAMTAALSAGRQKMDLFGVIMLGAVTALGGGTIRDMVLGAYPLTWVAEPRFLLAVVAAAVATVYMSFLMHYFRHVFLALDALGLAVFSVLGAQKALEHGHGLVIAAVAAVLTGVFGGILRDLLSDRIPLVLSAELYASISVLAAFSYAGLMELGLSDEVAGVVTVCLALALRVAAIYFGWSLPVFEYRGAEQPMDPRLRLSARIVRDGARKAKRKAGQAKENLKHPKRAGYAALSKLGVSKSAKGQRASQDWELNREWNAND